MLPPILPRPTNPICMLELLLDRVDVADVDAHGRQAVVAQRLEIAVRLGSDQRAEGVGLAGDLEVLAGARR